MACYAAEVEALAALLEFGIELPSRGGATDLLSLVGVVRSRPLMKPVVQISEDDDDKVYRWRLKLEQLTLYLLDRLEPGHC